MTNGWTKLHRQLLESEWWVSEPFTKPQAWVDLFGMANHEDGSFWVRKVEVKVKRGQIGWSEVTMAKRWQWSRNKTRRFINWLKTKQQISVEKSTITTVITILNYEKYQGTIQQVEQQVIQQVEHKQEDKKKYIKNAKGIFTKEERIAKYGLKPMTELELFEMAKGFGIVTDEVRKIYDKVWADVELGIEGKFDVKNIKATVRTWTDLGLNRWKNVELPGEWDLQIDALKHNPDHEKLVKESAERLERGESD